MFTLQDIKDAHAKVRSGADFPAYIQDLIMLWVHSYKVFVADWHAEYVWVDWISLVSDPTYDTLLIAHESNPEQFIAYLKAHQQWESDYMTFCRQSAETWVSYWIVDTASMTCTYYDSVEKNLLVENIPTI